MLFCLTFHLLFLFGNILLKNHWIYACIFVNDNIIDNVMLKVISTKLKINAKNNSNVPRKLMYNQNKESLKH